MDLITISYALLNHVSVFLRFLFLVQLCNLEIIFSIMVVCARCHPCSCRVSCGFLSLRELGGWLLNALDYTQKQWRKRWRVSQMEGSTQTLTPSTMETPTGETRILDNFSMVEMEMHFHGFVVDHAWFCICNSFAFTAKVYWHYTTARMDRRIISRLWGTHSFTLLNVGFILSVALRNWFVS